MINFIVLKWGTKYDSQYVNRLHNSIKKHYKKPFKFTCITDDSSGLNCETLPLNILSSKNSKSVFTCEKLQLYDMFNKGKYCLFDLDILVTKDLTGYFDEYDFVEPRFILNRWQNHSRIYNSFFTSDCFINSSFVTWKDDQLSWLYKDFNDHLPIIKFRYKTVDKFVFYKNFDKLKFHPPKLVYAYSFGAEYENDIEPFKQRHEYSVVLFHTSHKRPKGIELHDATGWAKNLWISYDE